jgi:hypothetical protein
VGRCRHRIRAQHPRRLSSGARVILTEGGMLGDDNAARRDESTLRSYLEATVRELGDDNIAT